MDKNQAYIKVIAILSEKQKIIAKLVERLAVNHPDAITQNSPERAIAEVLSAQNQVLALIRSAQFPCSKAELYELQGGVLKTEIGIERLDCTLLLNLLKSIEGLIPSYTGAGQCQNGVQHQNCKMTKNHSCHINKTSNGRNKRATARHPGWLSYHQCKLCTKNNTRSSCCVCCDQCNMCGYCNDQLPENLRCPLYRLVCALNVSLCFRNIASHLTPSKLDGFLSGKESFEDLPNVVGWNDLIVLLKHSYTEIVDYLSKLLFVPERQQNIYKVRLEHKFETIVTTDSDQLLKSYHATTLNYLETADQWLYLRNETKEVKSTLFQMQCSLDELKQNIMMMRSESRDSLLKPSESSDKRMSK